MLSEDGEAVAWRAGLSLWGEVHDHTPRKAANDDHAPTTCPIRFQGQWEDAKTGLYYNRFRYYDPDATQYLSPDPIGLEGGVRPQAYVADPNSLIDPLGLAGCPNGNQSGGNNRPTPPLVGRGDVPNRSSAARSAANARRLNNQLTAEAISREHGFEKHVLQQGEFGGLGIRTKRQYQDHIENVLNNPSDIRYTSDGRIFYLQESTGTVVVRNPNASDMSTAFQPQNWNYYIENKLPNRGAPY